MIPVKAEAQSHRPSLASTTASSYFRCWNKAADEDAPPPVITDEVYGDTEEEREKNLDVVFRFVNTQQSSRKCPPSYETFSPFDPDPASLSHMTLFKHYISTTDFEVVIDALNAIIAAYRTYSKRWIVVLIMGSFVALIISIFAHYAAGISAQLLLLIACSLAQSILRRRCVGSCNGFLSEEVNEKLRETRDVYIKVQLETDGCAQWLECDICQQQGILKVATLTRRKQQVPNPLQTWEVQAKEGDEFSDMDSTSGSMQSPGRSSPGLSREPSLSKERSFEYTR